MNYGGEKKMTREEVIKLYEKERDYQNNIFGEYKNNESLNLASFLLFLDSYLNKAKRSYTSKWTRDLPPWLLHTRESLIQDTSPVGAYSDLIKIMALAGAALESYTLIDIDKWREEGIKEKWE